MLDNVEWLNTRDLYIDYCHISELPFSALALIEEYGSFFDDKYAYWQPRGRNGQLLALVKRRPVWMKSKRMPAEKFHMHIDAKKLGQRKLLEAKE